MASKFVIYGVLLVVACFVFEVDAEDSEIVRDKRFSSVPLVLKIFSIGAPFRFLGIGIGIFLAFVGLLLNGVGLIGGVFFNGLGHFLGTLGHLIGIIANAIGSAGTSNFQLWDKIKASLP